MSAALLHPQTMRCLTVGKAQLSWYSSPGCRHTCWTPFKQVYLRLIRQQDSVPVIHALGQVVFSKLFAGFFVSQLQKRLPSGTTAMQTDLLQCVAYGLSNDKLTFHFCNHLKQCWQHSCVCFLKPASAPDAQHKDSTSLIDRCLFRVKPILENLCMALATVLKLRSRLLPNFL